MNFESSVCVVVAWPRGQAVSWSQLVHAVAVKQAAVGRSPQLLEASLEGIVNRYMDNISGRWSQEEWKCSHYTLEHRDKKIQN